MAAKILRTSSFNGKNLVLIKKSVHYIYDNVCPQVLSLSVSLCHTFGLMQCVFSIKYDIFLKVFLWNIPAVADPEIVFSHKERHCNIASTLK